jgi:threonine aldolase
VALGTEAKTIAHQADSVMFCLSKGLCAPVGSLVAGSREFIREARLKRKILGGGMRQAGILALTEQTKRLAADHERAKKLARELAAIPGVKIDTAGVEINLVFFSWPYAQNPEEISRILEIFKKRNILINPPDGGSFRFVTHYWIGDAEMNAVLTASREAFKLPARMEAPGE